MDKMDTQGMSGPVTKGCSDNIYPHDENGEPILPKGEWKELPIFNDKERAELKGIMLEALREYHTGYNASPWTLDDFQE